MAHVHYIDNLSAPAEAVGVTPEPKPFDLKETLQEQMKTLAEHSSHLAGERLPELTHAMVEVANLLFALENQVNTAGLKPRVGETVDIENISNALAGRVKKPMRDTATHL